MEVKNIWVVSAVNLYKNIHHGCLPEFLIATIALLKCKIKIMENLGIDIAPLVVFIIFLIISIFTHKKNARPQGTL